MIVTDFITGGFGLIEKLIEAHKVNEWAKLVFGFVLTFVCTFCAATGQALIRHSETPVAIGYGLVSAAGAVLALFMYNPRTRGIMVVTDKSNPLDMSQFQATEKTK